MDLQITPEPDEEERRAILEALAAEEDEERPESPWAQAVRPAREGNGP